MKRTPITLKGFKKLKAKLEFLKKKKRPKIISSIISARSQGDLRENAEYQAAREEQSFYEGKIKEIELKLSTAQIIDITKIVNVGKIIFGSTIVIQNMKTKKKLIYKIVGEEESDIKNNLISVNSPIARGLIGKSVGKIAVIVTPKGKVEYKILTVKYI
ncbi:transcription elongation factor GreA [Candidatus Riesia sp. GBBU]|nr:transcription elongation factor GreA [Candidatus Riesia sp. GBBU]